MVNIMEIRTYYMRTKEKNMSGVDVIEIAINDLKKKLKLS